MNKIFLGGTYAETNWRKELIDRLDTISYFNPVVKDWTHECQAIEIKEKEIECNIHFYCITKEMKGVFSIAEAVDSVHNKSKTTVFHVIPDGFDFGQKKSLQAVVDLINSRGGIAYIDDNLEKSSKLLNFLTFRNEVSIDRLSLSKESENVMNKNNIYTLQQLSARYSNMDFQKLTKCTREVYEEMTNYLVYYGMYWGGLCSHVEKGKEMDEVRNLPHNRPKNYEKTYDYFDI